MPRRYSYPENLLFVLHLNEETQRTICYDALTDDQRKGLEYALSALSEREQIVLREHFCEGIGYISICSIRPAETGRFLQSSSISPRTSSRMSPTPVKARVFCFTGISSCPL